MIWVEMISHQLNYPTKTKVLQAVCGKSKSAVHRFKPMYGTFVQKKKVLLELQKRQANYNIVMAVLLRITRKYQSCQVYHHRPDQPVEVLKAFLFVEHFHLFLEPFGSDPVQCWLYSAPILSPQNPLH